MRLAGKVAIVTGGSQGIGRAIALAFAREGAKVIVVSRTAARCEKVVAEIIESSGTAMSIPADIACEADMTRMAEQTRAKFQRIDILVNCAGVNLPFKTVTELTLEEWNGIISVNLTGTFLSCRSVVPQMIAQGSGKIINISSIGGRVGAPGRSPYRASKAAIINFTQSLAAELKEAGIGVNVLCPGPVATEMFREITGGNVPAGTMVPEDIAAVAVFLASDESRALTGSTVEAFGPRNPMLGSTSATRKPQ
jgi:3-oxoacyl-[acyl-carrier protein] reductase